MKSLRDLLLALLTALRTLFRQDPRRAPRPVHGPAHPLRYVPDATAAAPAPADPTTWSIARGARPKRPELPPHIAALLARAPSVEPEFVRLARPFERISARVRIFAPRPPAPDTRKPSFRASQALDRIVTALDPITRWLARASPARRVRAAS